MTIENKELEKENKIDDYLYYNNYDYDNDKNISIKKAEQISNARL